MNMWRKRNWIRNAKHYYILLCGQSEEAAYYHATRIALDVEKEYGPKVKNWPYPKGIVEEDFDYWEN